jgi:hypothetical protein
MDYDTFNENDVRNIANEYLLWHYRNSKIIGEIYTSETEEKTKAGKFPDGFHAFRRTHNTICVVTLECKKELDSTSLGFKIHPERLTKWILITASIFHVLFFILWFKYNQFFGLYLEPITFILSLLTFWFLYSFTKKFFVKNKPNNLLVRNVFYQLEQYPADEQWLAFSKPINDKQYERFEEIKNDCRRKGIGLLIVDMDTEIVSKEVPTKSKTRAGFSYLSYYDKEEKIYNQLMQDETAIYQLNKRTPAQKRHYWKLVVPLLLIVCTALYFRLRFNDLPIPIATTIQGTEEQTQNQLETQQIEHTTQQTMVYEQETERIIASTIVVLDNVYDNLEAAEWRVKKLHQLGLEAKLGNLNDYQINLNIDKDYFVFLDDEKGKPQLLYSDYQEKLLNTGVEVIGAKIIEIEEK